jgi:hypothetical protein
MAYGLKQAGYTHALLVEIRRPDAASGFGPVRDVAEVDFTPYKVDLVAGGVPSHSAMPRPRPRRRAQPVRARAVRECEPAAFLFENVPGLLRPAFAPYLASVTRRLSLGYTVGTHLVDAADYGRSGASGACSSARRPAEPARPVPNSAGHAARAGSTKGQPGRPSATSLGAAGVPGAHAVGVGQAGEDGGGRNERIARWGQLRRARRRHGSGTLPAASWHASKASL